MTKKSSDERQTSHDNGASEDKKTLIEKIHELKKERKAVILAHNYQEPAIQDIADVVGDSLDLCIKSIEFDDIDTIVFCGVDFMAETAAILNPDKTVIIPDATARCPMAAMLDVDEILEYKKRYPGAPVVLYINTTAACKAEADTICTSSNAVDVVNSFPSTTVLFGPDKNMAYWVSKKTDKTIIPIPEHGYCVVHERLISKEDALMAKKAHPNALILAHPECRTEVQDIADFIASTNQMVSIAKKQDSKEFIIATEEGLCYRLKKAMPEKEFYPFKRAVCVNMKKNSLAKVYAALKEQRPVVTVDKEIAKKARRAIEAMLALKP